MVTDARRNPTAAPTAPSETSSDLIDEATLREMLSISAARARRLVGERTFPPVVRRGAGGDLWDLDAVDRWLDAAVWV